MHANSEGHGYCFVDLTVQDTLRGCVYDDSGGLPKVLKPKSSRTIVCLSLNSNVKCSPPGFNKEHQDDSDGASFDYSKFLK